MKRKKSLIISIIIIVGLMAAAGFFRSKQEPEVKLIPEKSLDNASHKKQTQNFLKTPRSLNLGFVPQGNAVFMVRKWQPLSDYLSQNLGVPVEMVFRSTYQEIITALVNGEIDVCFTGAYMYVLAKQQADILPLVRRKKFGSSSYQSLIVVRKDSPLHAIEDLKNRSFAFVSKKSTSGYLLPMAMMRQRGIADPNSYFSKVIHTETHDSALLAVYSKSIDAAAISVTRWRPEKKEVKALRIIWESDLLFLGPVSVRADLDAELMRSLKGAFLEIGKNSDTLALSKHLEIEGFEEAADVDYDIIRKAIQWTH